MNKFLKAQETRMKRYAIESEQRWAEECASIPHIQFPPEWKVKIIPPFGDAVVRFLVELPSGKDKSVYLDCRSSLGYFGADVDVPTPYWEVYPYRGDTARCHRENVELLLSYIADEGDEDAQA